MKYYLLVTLFAVSPITVKGQNNSIFLSGGSALFFNTSASISAQRNILTIGNIDLGVEVNYGKKSDFQIAREIDDVNFTYNSAALVTLFKIRETRYFEINTGISRLTKKNSSNGDVSKFKEFYFALGFLWKYEKLNLRLGVSSQEMLNGSIGMHF